MPTSRDTATYSDTATSGDIELFRETELSGASEIEPAGGLTIDCDRCALRDTNACDDCVVSFLLEREPDDAVVIDADEARAMRMLERAGLVPTLRFSSRTG
jgi:hypothetical protein